MICNFGFCAALYENRPLAAASQSYSHLVESRPFSQTFLLATMFSLYYGPILCVFVLLKFAANGNANIYPPNHERLAARVSVAAGIT